MPEFSNQSLNAGWILVLCQTCGRRPKVRGTSPPTTTSAITSLMDVFTNGPSVLAKEASPLGLPISWAKTKIQSLSDYLPPLQPVIRVNTEEVEVVPEFVYLSLKITSDSVAHPILRSIGACSWPTAPLVAARKLLLISKVKIWYFYSISCFFFLTVCLFFCCDF